MSTSRDLNRFLRGTNFKRQIVSKYERFEILSEGGLRTAVANLLDAKLRTMSGTAESHTVTCETRLGKVIPDILVWKGKVPRIWIELKDTRLFSRSSADADWEKLRKYLPLYRSIKGGFLIYVARKRRKRGVQLHIKRGRDALRLWPIAIILEIQALRPSASFVDWPQKMSTVQCATHATWPYVVRAPPGPASNAGGQMKGVARRISQSLAVHPFQNLPEADTRTGSRLPSERTSTCHTRP